MTKPGRDQMAQFMNQCGNSSKEDDGEYWEHEETAAQGAVLFMTSVVPISTEDFSVEIDASSQRSDGNCDFSTAKNCLTPTTERYCAYDDSMRNVKSQQPLSRPTDPREWHDVTLVKLKMIAPRLCARIED
jgi:hypothetical protein